LWHPKIISQKTKVDFSYDDKADRTAQQNDHQTFDGSALLIWFMK